MAKFEIKFIDFCEPEDFIVVRACSEFKNKDTEEEQDIIRIKGEDSGNYFNIVLDKSTAIKFAKTLRTEINKL